MMKYSGYEINKMEEHMKTDLTATVEIPKEIEKDFRIWVVIHGGKIVKVEEK